MLYLNIYIIIYLYLLIIYNYKKSNPNDRYYNEDFRNNRNNNDEDFYRYRNESGEKMNGNEFNKQSNRPLSPVSMNLSKNARSDYPPLRDNTLPRPPNYYDDYRDDPKKYKSFYYSSNHSSNQKNSSSYSHEQDQEKGNMKYISPPATNNPRLSNEPRNLNGKTTALPSNSNTIHTSSSASAEIIDRDYRNRSDNSPSSSNYPPYPPPSAFNEDRYYGNVSGGNGSGNSRESKGPNGNQNPSSSAVRPIPESMNTNRNYRSEPRYTTRNNELPPKGLNSSKFLPPHQLNSPHNQDIVSENNSRHYYSQPPPPPSLSQRSPVPSYSTSNLPTSNRPNYNSPSTNPPTDLNRFSLYKIPPQPNSPRQSTPSTLPPISSLSSNNDVSYIYIYIYYNLS